MVYDIVGSAKINMIAIIRFKPSNHVADII